MSMNPDDGPPSYEEATRSTPPATEDDLVEELPSTSESASGFMEASSNQEKKHSEKAEEAGWREDILPAAHSVAAGPGSLPVSIPMVLPPGLQPLLMLDTLLLRGMYERGKGRRYRIANKHGDAVLYARSIRKGHHRPKDFQLYDSTRTAVVGQLTFSQAADSSLYANLECPPRVSLATIRAEDSTQAPETADSNSTDMSLHRRGVRYTICNVLGQPVFSAFSSSIMNAQDLQIKIYSAVSPSTSVADIWWDFDEMMDGPDETQSFFGEKNEDLSEKRVKITFPLDLEVKMKAALLAMCLLKDKIDHRMAKGGGGCISEAFGASAGDVPFSRHSRRRHYKH